MQTMESATVVSLDRRRERGRMNRVIDTRRQIEGDRRRRRRNGGRAWLNGQELGGRREALAHLATTHD